MYFCLFLLKCIFLFQYLFIYILCYEKLKFNRVLLNYKSLVYIMMKLYKFIIYSLAIDIHSFAFFQISFTMKCTIFIILLNYIDIYIIIYNILRKYKKKHLTYILDYSFN